MQIVKLVDCWWRELLTYKMGSVYYDEKLFALVYVLMFLGI